MLGIKCLCSVRKVDQMRNVREEMWSETAEEGILKLVRFMEGMSEKGLIKIIHVGSGVNKEGELGMRLKDGVKDTLGDQGLNVQEMGEASIGKY